MTDERRLRLAVLAANNNHVPSYGALNGSQVCKRCREYWPCDTLVLARSVADRLRHNQYCSAAGWPCPIGCEQWDAEPAVAAAPSTEEPKP